MALQDELANKQIEVLLDIHAKKLMAEIHQLREELSRTKEEILKGLKEVSARQDTPAPVAAPVAQPATETPVQPVPQDATAEAPASTAPIDRNGVAPAEVSIEKIFYMGK